MSNGGARPIRRKVARKHEWLDGNGNYAFSHIKFDDGSWGYRHPVDGNRCKEHPDAKIFRHSCPRKPGVAGGLLWNMADLLETLADELTVGWFAGEKDADAGFQAALCDTATSVHQGESAETYPEQFEIFSGARSRIDVYLDDDATGRANGLARYEGLVAVGVPAKRLRLLLPADGANDVSDHLADADARARGFRELSVAALRKAVREDAKERRVKEEGPKPSERLSGFHAALQAIGCRPATSGQDWTCPHPRHPDTYPSFGVTVGESGGLVLNCQKCMPRTGTPEHAEWLDEILDALGLDAGAIAPPKRKRSAKGGRGGGDKETVSQAIIRMALDDYRLGKSDDARPFAVRHGSNVVRFFERGVAEFADELAERYFAETGKAAGTTAMAEAMAVLRGRAAKKDAEPVALRLGLIGAGEDVAKAIAIDMGDAAGRAIVVGPEGWEVRDGVPMLFRRTKATLPYPEPVRGGDVSELGSLLNMRKADFDLVVAWLLASFMPEIQHPVLMLTGAQGTGKSDATRMLSLLADPSSVPLRKRPREEQEWSVAAHASWVVSLENMSFIPDWLSDDLCRAVTGDGVIERQLHTNDDIRIRSFRRVILINGIDPGGVRGDLADRMFVIRLQRIVKRLSERAIEAKFAAISGLIFGALLDLLVEVMRVQLSGKHLIDYQGRMGDFAMVVRAVDQVRGSDAFSRFVALHSVALQEITEDDPITSIVLRYLTANKGVLEGTPSGIYEALDTFVDDRRPDGWPKTARSLGQAFTRLEPGWLNMGIKFERTKPDRNKRLWRLSYTQSNENGGPGRRTETHDGGK